MDAAGALNKSINGTLYNNSAHIILYCNTCHEYDHAGNLTLNGNYLTVVDPFNSSDDVYSPSNFSLCYRCHFESNLLSISVLDPFINLLKDYLGIPVFNQPVKTNFAGNSWWKGDESNLHYFHVVELRAMGGIPSKSAVCSNCHDPHGTAQPALVPDTIELVYIDQNGNPIPDPSLWNQSRGAKVTGFKNDLQFCQPCHGSEDLYQRTLQPVEITISHASIPIKGVGTYSTCADYPCHTHDNDLRIQHVSLKKLKCETCHLNNRTDVQTAIIGKKTKCRECHNHDAQYVPAHGGDCTVCHNS